MKFYTLTLNPAFDIHATTENFRAFHESLATVTSRHAGDSTIAGFLAAFAEGENGEACLCTAVAYGTAACLTEGTLPPDMCDVNTIKRDIKTLKKGEF